MSIIQLPQGFQAEYEAAETVDAREILYQPLDNCDQSYNCADPDQNKDANTADGKEYNGPLLLCRFDVLSMLTTEIRIASVHLFASEDEIVKPLLSERPYAVGMSLKLDKMQHDPGIATTAFFEDGDSLPSVVCLVVFKKPVASSHVGEL